MSFSPETKRGTVPLKELLEPARELVRIAKQMLDPEQNEFQRVSLQAPNGTRLEVSRCIDIDDDIYIAGSRDPLETGLSISFKRDGEEGSFQLPRRPESVNEISISDLKGTSPETLISLAKTLRESKRL